MAVGAGATPEMIDLLLSHGASINVTHPASGLQPIHMATLAGHPYTIAHLLKKGADYLRRVDVPPLRSVTALHLGAMKAASILTPFLEIATPDQKEVSLRSILFLSSYYLLILHSLH